MNFGARALIRLGALEHNLGFLRGHIPGARTMVVIKANAYGHGMVAVAQHLSDADSFAVARLREALHLRESGIEQPIVLLAGVQSDEELLVAASNECEIVVHSPEQIDLLRTTAAKRLTVWLKIDTGMHRLGFRPEDAAELIERLRQCGAVGELRLMTHLANADDVQSPVTHEQLERFGAVAAGFEGSVSIANSATMLGFPEVRDAQSEFGFTGEHWIRPGIALYGISPFADRTGTDLGLKPVMRFEARLIARKPIIAGARVGYQGRYVTDRDTMLGIIAAGYGDGYTRHFRDGTPVWLNGRRVPLIGNVSMDMIAVDLGTDSDDAVGDVATLWGDELPVEEVAPWADAIPYELVCGIINREASKITA